MRSNDRARLESLAASLNEDRGKSIVWQVVEDWQPPRTPWRWMLAPRKPDD